jgi:hypothetical protein
VTVPRQQGGISSSPQLGIRWRSVITQDHRALLFWQFYSFEPEYQDKVVYRWLSDKQAWNIDISKQLRQGKLNKVLRELSSTWTSLGYGIEDNTMTGYLPEIYQRMLKEELAKSSEISNLMPRSCRGRLNPLICGKPKISVNPPLQ